MRSSVAVSAMAAMLCVPMLSGCTTTSIDTAVQQNLPSICRAADIAHAAFVAAAEGGAIPASTVRREATAYEALGPLCEDPSSATAASVLVAAASAYAIVASSLREAERRTRS